MKIYKTEELIEKGTSLHMFAGRILAELHHAVLE